jgi:hypothetical protein
MVKGLRERKAADHPRDGNEAAAGLEIRNPKAEIRGPKPEGNSKS